MKNEDRKLPKLTFVDISQHPTKLAVEKQTLTLGGVKTNIFAGHCVSADFLFGKLPMLQRIYQMVQEDLQAQYKGYSFSQ